MRSTIHLSALVIALFFTFFYDSLNAETRVSGQVQGEWTPEGSPYIVTADISIAQGSSLRILPGTLVAFNEGYSLTVSGLLTSIGTVDERIVIQGVNHIRWGGIRILDAADDRTTLSYTNISDGRRTGADGNGGALSISSSSPTISDCIFDRNDTETYGGTIFIGYNANPTFYRNIIQNSSSAHAAVSVFQARVTFDNNEISHCTGTYVAGIVLEQGQQSIIINNRFLYNSISANAWGSAIYLDAAASAIVENNIFAHNEDGVVFIGPNCSIDRFNHNTLAANIGHSTVLVYGGRVTISNSIIWQDGPAFYNTGQINVTYSDVRNPADIQLGEGCIDSDPRFLDVDNNDFELNANSPCIDAGDPNSPRDPDGSRADMGFIPPFTIDLTVTPDALNFGPVAVANEVVADVWLKYTSNNAEAPDIRLRLEPGEGNYWIGVDPAEAELTLNDSLVFEVIVFCPPRFRLGEHAAEVRIFVNEGEAPSVIIPVDINVVAGIGTLSGVVTDAQSGETLEGVKVELKGAFRSTFTDENGRYLFDPLPAYHYTITIGGDGFLPYESEEFEVSNDEDVVRNIEILYAACEPDQRELNVEIVPGESSHSTIVLRNSGSGDCSFTAEPRVPALENVEPLDQRLLLPIEQIVQDNRIQGVEFANDHFYVSGGNSGRGRGKIYILDKDGNYEGSFDQFIVSNWGMRDLAWDGELLWGIEDATLYGFTTDGHLDRVIQTPINSGRCLAYDKDREIFWASATTSSIYCIDPVGNVVTTIRNQGLRMYGMGYYPEDAEGAKLYIFANDANHTCFLRKMNTETGEIIEVTDIDDGTYTPSGCAITNQWDPLSWVFIDVKRAIAAELPDAIEILHLDGRSDWIDVNPRAGDLPAGEERELDVFIDAEFLPNANSFEAEIIVTHTGRGGRFVIPVAIDVRIDAGLTERGFQLSDGLDLISLNLQPENTDIRTIFSPLVESGQLIWVKDQIGRFYRPGANDFCNIPAWNTAEAYLVKSLGECRLNIIGRPIPSTRPIPLHRGWQTAAYYPRVAAPAPTALSSIAENLVIAKDAQGRFYSPNWGYSNLGNCYEGKGYKLLMAGDCNLVWNTEGMMNGIWQKTRQPELYSSIPATGSDMSLLMTGFGGLSGEVGVFVGGNLVGSGIIEDDFCGIAVRGNLKAVSDESGATEGDQLTLKIKTDSGVEEVVKGEVLEGKLAYQTDGFTVVRLTEIATPQEFTLSEAYPNPFNMNTSLRFALPESGSISIVIIDATGRLVMEQKVMRPHAGAFNWTWSGNNTQENPVTSGIYFCRAEFVSLSGEHHTAISKLIAIR